MNNQKVGLYISTLRKKNNMTQNDLAQTLGVTDKAISKWERGAGYPDISMLRPLADALGTTVNALLEGEDADETIHDSQKDVNNALAYADKVNMVKIKHTGQILSFIIGVGLLIGCFVSVIVNVAVSNRLTWSVLVIAGAVLTGAIIIPIFLHGLRGLFFSLCLLTILIIPFLATIEYFSTGFGTPSSWLFPLGLPISGLWIGLAWIMLLIFRFKKMSILFFSGIGTLLSIPCVVLTNYLIDLHLETTSGYISTVSTAIGLICVAGVLLFIGALKRKPKYKV